MFYFYPSFLWTRKSFHPNNSITFLYLCFIHTPAILVFFNTSDKELGKLQHNELSRKQRRNLPSSKAAQIIGFMQNANKSIETGKIWKTNFSKGATILLLLFANQLLQIIQINLSKKLELTQMERSLSISHLIYWILLKETLNKDFKRLFMVWLGQVKDCFVIQRHFVRNKCCKILCWCCKSCNEKELFWSTFPCIYHECRCWSRSA